MAPPVYPWIAVSELMIDLMTGIISLATGQVPGLNCRSYVLDGIWPGRHAVKGSSTAVIVVAVLVLDNGSPVDPAPRVLTS